MICYRGLFTGHRLSQTIKALTLWVQKTASVLIASYQLFLLVQKIHAKWFTMIALEKTMTKIMQVPR